MVNEELFLDNPLHVILNKSKLAYRIYVILIANKELKKIRCKQSAHQGVLRNIFSIIVTKSKCQNTLLKYRVGQTQLGSF
jgi:hypothetical protein